MSFARNTGRRSSSSSATFATLEARRLMAVDLSAVATYETGFYGKNDTIDVDVDFTQKGSAGVLKGTPIIVTVYLSKDKAVSDDDIKLTSTVFLLGEKSGKQTQDLSGDTGYSPAAGSYYTATEVLNLGYPGVKATTTWSSGRDTTIVTDRLDSHTINGTSKKDRVTVRENWSSVIVTVNGKSRALQRSEISGSGLVFNLGGGDDSFSVFNNKHGVTANLTVNGGAGNDTITTGNGDDRLDGGAGNDRLAGGKGRDTLIGSSGKDVLDGGEGADSLDGGSSTDKAKKDVADTLVKSIENLY